jgi:3-deoxy-D-arabino-heptulosonate 7-phosphate (DAHP) synthase class II
LRTMDLFISHEGLGLAYEEAMTREVNGTPQLLQIFNIATAYFIVGLSDMDIHESNNDATQHESNIYV